MTALQQEPPEAPAPPPAPVPATTTTVAPVGRGEGTTVALVVLGLVALVALRDRLGPLVDGPAISTWLSVFTSLCVQALPFLVLGVLVSAVLTAFVPAHVLARALPRRTAFAVPTAGAAGLLLPGCECGSVPVAGTLASRGVAPAAALTFMLAAPAINPVVLVSTAVAFPGQPEMVVSRLVASFLLAVLVGLAWARWGRSDWLHLRPRTHLEGSRSRGETLVRTAGHDLHHAGGFLVLGALAAATMNVLLPRELVDSLAGTAITALLTLALLAFVLAVCSEADAFIAASLGAFGPRAQLAFMVVGPAVDVKLVALQAGTFGRGFALRFAPAVFLTALAVVTLVAAVLL